MSSRTRRNANRRNALKSTGPRSALGKRRTRNNALSHGFSLPIDPSTVGDALDRLQALLVNTGYQPRHTCHIALCLLDYDRVNRAESQLPHRMPYMGLVHGFMAQPPDLNDNLSRGRQINQMPAGGPHGEAFWQKIESGTHFHRYRRRTLNQLLKALRAQNDDYK